MPNSLYCQSSVVCKIAAMDGAKLGSCVKQPKYCLLVIRCVFFVRGLPFLPQLENLRSQNRKISVNVSYASCSELSLL